MTMGEGNRTTYCRKERLRDRKGIYPMLLCIADSKTVSEPVAMTEIIAIYAPMIYTAPCVMFWMLEDPLRFFTRASGRGFGPGNRDFFEPWKIISYSEGQNFKQGS
jgi:hypothetical protein